MGRQRGLAVEAGKGGAKLCCADGQAHVGSSKVLKVPSPNSSKRQLSQPVVRGAERQAARARTMSALHEQLRRLVRRALARAISAAAASRGAGLGRVQVVAEEQPDCLVISGALRSALSGSACRPPARMPSCEALRRAVQYRTMAWPAPRSLRSAPGLHSVPARADLHRNAMMTQDRAGGEHD